MKVLHYASSLSRSAGGLYYSVSGMCHALADLGVDISVCGGADETFLADRNIWGNLKIAPHSLNTSYGFSTDVFKQIKSMKPDLVHIHGVWSASTIYGQYAAHRGAKVVVSPRGMLDPWILARRPLIKKVHSTFFERPLLKKASLHALNAAELQAAIKFLPSLRQRSFVIPNGIPNIVVEKSEKTKEFLYIGRLHEKKQVLQLVQHWKSAAIDPSFTLKIAGWGDKRYEQQLVSEIGESKQITFVGSLYGEEKSAALRSARFFILPSLSEGLPMAVLEAIQNGCIPIITDECNLPEMFADGIAIRMANNFSDFRAVVAQASSLSLSDQKARALASEEYAAKYSWSSIAEKMIEQYQTILASR